MSDAGRTGLDEVVKCPVSGCTLTVDVVLRSSDKVLIGAHQANLAQFSEGFPTPSDVTVTDEPVDLTEGSDTLNVLMEFVHKHRHPSLSNVYLDEMLKIGEAAEKYMIYGAMNACQIRLSIRDFVGDEALQVLSYAVKFAYPEVADRAALYVLRGWTSIREVADAFGPGNEANTLAWVQYREEYLSAMETMLRGSHKVTKWNGEDKTCDNADGHWERFYGAILRDLPKTRYDFFSKSVSTDPHRGYQFFSDILQRHQAHLSECSSGWCNRRVNRWRREFEQDLRSIKPFHTFLPSH